MADLSRLTELMRALRDRENGCPWDLEQTYETIVPHTLEEAYEVADTIESGNFRALPGELGDLLFQVIFYCQLGAEDQRFSLADVVETLTTKMIARHPHVFGDAAASDSAAVAVAWEARKANERKLGSATSELDDIPRALAALSRATKVQKRAARVGFDWPDSSGAWAKLTEEIDELAQAERLPGRLNSDAMADEMGDVLFSVVNLARHLGLDAERCLRLATRKFERRFRAVEAQLQVQGMAFAGARPEYLDQLWNDVKAREKELGAEAPKQDLGEVRGQK